MKQTRDTDQEYIKLAVELRKALLKSSFENGYIGLDELLNTNPMQKLANAFKEGPEGKDPDVNLVIDHRDTILKQARVFLKNGQYEYANIFYALYFEHEINSLITLILTRKQISQKTSIAVIKHSINDKLTWIMEILAVRPPNKNFVDFIKPLSEDRNSFIHYKWIGKNINNKDDDKKKYHSEIDRQVAYFKSYVSNIIYDRKKNIISKRIDDLAKVKTKS